MPTNAHPRRDPRADVEDDVDADAGEPLVDLASSIRAARTAVATGRAPVPAATAKMRPFQLKEALARLEAPDEAVAPPSERASGHASGERPAVRVTYPTPAFEITADDIAAVEAQSVARSPSTAPPRLAALERPVDEAKVVTSAAPARGPSVHPPPVAAVSLPAHATTWRVLFVVGVLVAAVVAVLAAR